MSLSTTYGLGIVLMSLAGVGSAFAANYIHPLQGGAEPPMTALEIVAAEGKILEEQKRLLQNTDILLNNQPPTVPAAEELMKGGGVDDDSGGYRHYLRTTRRQRYGYHR